MPSSSPPSEAMRSLGNMGCLDSSASRVALGAEGGFSLEKKARPGEGSAIERSYPPSEKSYKALASQAALPEGRSLPAAARQPGKPRKSLRAPGGAEPQQAQASAGGHAAGALQAANSGSASQPAEAAPHGAAKSAALASLPSPLRQAKAPSLAPQPLKAAGARQGAHTGSASRPEAAAYRAARAYRVSGAASANAPPLPKAPSPALQPLKITSAWKAANSGSAAQPAQAVSNGAAKGAALAGKRAPIASMGIARIAMQEGESRDGAGAAALRFAGRAADSAARAAVIAIKAPFKMLSFAFGAAKAVATLVFAATGLIALLGVFFAIFASVAAIASLVSALLAVKAPIPEITQAYAYVTRLDAELEEKINSIASQAPPIGVDSFVWEENGAPIEAGGARVFTDADKALLYLDSKHGSYKFSEVKSEIAQMHSKLHSYSVWVEGGEMHVAIESIGMQEWIGSLGGLSDSQKEQAKFLEAAQYASLSELASPLGQSFEASERWGWRLGGSGLEMHHGLDAPMQAGAKATCLLEGKVASAGESPSLGKYASVASKGDRLAVYAHLEEVYVSQGQKLALGEEIGVVGSSEGGQPALHLEFSIDGDETNPAFFLEGYRGIAQASGAGIGPSHYPPILLGPGSKGFVFPASGTVSSFTASRTGSHANYHAIDVAVPVGTPVYASKAGTVTMAEYNGDYGYCVQIRHEEGYSTLYAHLSKFLVSVGAPVAQGQAIALSGNTGRSTGPHLHFEIRYNGERLDLRSFFDTAEGRQIAAGAESKP